VPGASEAVSKFVGDSSARADSASEFKPCCARGPLAEVMSVVLFDQKLQQSDPFAVVGICALTEVAAVCGLTLCRPEGGNPN
jgi:hypothetical protein